MFFFIKRASVQKDKDRRTSVSKDQISRPIIMASSPPQTIGDRMRKREQSSSSGALFKKGHARNHSAPDPRSAPPYGGQSFSESGLSLPAPPSRRTRSVQIHVKFDVNKALPPISQPTPIEELNEGLNNLTIAAPILPKEVEALIPNRESMRGAAYRAATESLYEVAQDLGDRVEVGSGDLYRDFEPEAACEDDSDVLVRSVLSGRSGRTGRSFRAVNTMGARRSNAPSTWRARLTSQHEEFFIKTLSTRLSGLDFEFDIKEDNEEETSPSSSHEEGMWPDAPIDVEITLIGADDEEVALVEETEQVEDEGENNNAEDDSQSEEDEIPTLAWPRPKKIGPTGVAEDERTQQERRRGKAFRHSAFVEGWEKDLVFSNLNE